MQGFVLTGDFRCFKVDMILNVRKNHKAYWGGGGYVSNFKSFGVLHPISHYGYIGGRGGGRGILYTCYCTVTYTCCCTVSTRMTPALWWAAMTAVLVFSSIVRGRVTRQWPQRNHSFKETGEPKQNQTEVSLLTSLMPYRKATLAPVFYWLKSTYTGNKISSFSLYQ